MALVRFTDEELEHQELFRRIECLAAEGMSEGYTFLPQATGVAKMPIVLHNPAGVFPPYRAYSHATEVIGDSRVLFISGLNGYEADGTTMPGSFEGQAELIWKHLKTVLAEANFTVKNIVSLRTYFADPAFDEQNAVMRNKHLEGHRPASTVVCCRLLDPLWKIEIEAVAAS